MIVKENYPEITFHQVKNLSEFMTILNGINARNYHFRGEDAEHDFIISGALRRLDNQAFYAHEAMLKDYYKRVANNLSSLEIANFMPYAQHHGLPTPLIDVSTSPLTALYFATTNVLSKKSFIFLFPKHRCFDVTHFLTDNWDRNLLVDFLHQANDLSLAFYENISKIKSVDEAYFNHLFNDLLKTCLLGKSEAAVLQAFLQEPLQPNLSSYYEMWAQTDTLQPIYQQWEQCLKPLLNLHMTPFPLTPKLDEAVIWYLILLQTYLSDVYYHSSRWESVNLPLLPLLTYNPTILFDRLLAQDGLFFYQLNLHLTEPAFVDGLVLSQDIYPSIMIEITNPKGLKKELNALGVNRAKMFPDPDNIAKHLKTVYYQKAREKD